MIDLKEACRVIVLHTRQKGTNCINGNVNDVTMSIADLEEAYADSELAMA